MRNYLLRSWYQPHLNWLSFLLWPFSLLFRSIVFCRRIFYKLHFFSHYTAPVPVIIVGNITVGGTGKTPMVIYLLALLKKQGYRPGVVTRGYGGEIKAPTLVEKTHTAKQVGDEALLIAERTEMPVVVGSRRVQAAKKLLKKTDCNLIISDDGLQHYALNRDVEIVMIDSERGLGNARCLPAGPLREPVSRLKQVNAVVLTNAAREPAEKNNFCMTLVPSKMLVNVKNPNDVIALNQLSGQSVHAVAGIAHPKRFFNLLKDAGLSVIPHAFPDHHVFQATDLQFDDDNIVLMTEKDAVKCRVFAFQHVWFLPVTAKLSSKFDEFVLKEVL